MLDVKLRHALLHVAVDAALIAVSGHAAAADEYERLENLRVIKPQLQTHHAADTDAGKDRRVDGFPPADRHDILAQIRHRNRRAGLIGITVTAKIYIDDLEISRKMGRLVEEQAPVEGIGVHENERIPLAGDFVVRLHAISNIVGHMGVRAVDKNTVHHEGFE